MPFPQLGLNQSALKGSEDEQKLLLGIIRSCGHLQDDPVYRLITNPNGQGYSNGQGMEDLRNRRIRDDLSRDYHIGDQTQRGLSGTGKSIGELDLLVSYGSDTPWTIIEALRVNDSTKTEWNRHLQKLCSNYNTRGFATLYLLTYVDADIATLQTSG